MENKKVSSTLYNLRPSGEGISYKVKKSCLQDFPPAAGRSSDMLPLRCSAIIAFLPYGKFGELSYMEIKHIDFQLLYALTLLLHLILIDIVD